MRIDYKLGDKFDFGLFLSAVALICIGLAAIYSATYNNPAAHGNFEKQLIWGFISLIIFFVIYSLPTNTFKIAAIPVYLFSLLLLIFVLVAGRRISGARSWLELGSAGFQPSEFAKLGTILMLAYFLSKTNTNIETFKDIVLSLFIGLLPVALILLEPDMGTAIVYLVLILTLIFWKGISLFGLFIVLSPAFVAVSSLFGTFYFLAAVILVFVALILFKKI